MLNCCSIDLISRIVEISFEVSVALSFTADFTWGEIHLKETKRQSLPFDFKNKWKIL